MHLQLNKYIDTYRCFAHHFRNMRCIGNVASYVIVDCNFCVTINIIVDLNNNALLQ